MDEKPKISHLSRDYILAKIEQLKPWYHKIDLGNGITTPGFDWGDKIWSPIKHLMDTVDYRDKTVLDLGSWDGMWAFEAENRGAAAVVATDARLEGYENLLFTREVLGSQVIPMCNVPVQELNERLSVLGFPEQYDIVQHFGLFYHLRDPLVSLAQSRRIMKDDAILLLETAFLNDDENGYMIFSGLPDNYRFYGPSDTWAPTKRCLREILIRSFLKPINEESWQYYLPPVERDVVVGRISMIATTLPESEGHIADWRKVFGSQ
jgi:SAM-dependent methyltransferase